MPFLMAFIDKIFITYQIESNMNDKSQEQSQQENEEQEVSQEQEKVKKIKSKKHQIVINLSECVYVVVKRAAKLLKWKTSKQIETFQWDVYWTDNAVQAQFLGKMQSHQKINHFPGMFNLARKNNLAKNLIQMKHKFPDSYSFFPKTWMIPVDYNNLKNYFNKNQKGKHKTIIVKPQASCQGKGIFITQSINQIDPCQHYVVQKYLCKPYLIDNLKFDMRIYVLLAGCDPLRIYVYKQGLARFATQQYQIPKSNNLLDLCMHLTNYAINKDNPNFVFNETVEQMDTGHKRSLDGVFQQMKQQGIDVVKIKHQINQIIIKTFISAQPSLKHHYKTSQSQNFACNMCFELLGFDIILNKNLKPYLLQINHTPSFAIDTPLDEYIKKNLIKDTFKLMNINEKSKKFELNKRQRQIQQRMLTGKKKKLSLIEKNTQIDNAQKKRDQYQRNNLGGFTKIYPVEQNQSKFKQLFEYAQQIYQYRTGSKKKRNQQEGLKKEKAKVQEIVKAKQVKKNFKTSTIKKTVSSRYLQQKGMFRRQITQFMIKHISIKDEKQKQRQKIQKKSVGAFIKPKIFQLGNFMNKL